MKTWVKEMALAATWLGAITVWSGGGLVQWITAGAVLASFGHMQVAARLEEKEARALPSSDRVECAQMLSCYLVGKEILWVLAFALSGAWVALAGVPLFLLYPMWRNARQKRCTP